MTEPILISCSTSNRTDNNIHQTARHWDERMSETTMTSQHSDMAAAIRLGIRVPEPWRHEPRTNNLQIKIRQM